MAAAAAAAAADEEDGDEEAVDFEEEIEGAEGITVTILLERLLLRLAAIF